ncbi:hypothetical protein FB107DRAFT_274986 [Schizophyllum commune]
MAPNAPSSSPVIPFCDTGALILNCANGNRLAIGRTYLASLHVGDAPSREEHILEVLGLNSRYPSALCTTRMLAAFWIEGEDEAEWKEIDFGSWDELSPFIHEICVVDKD